MKLLKFAQNLQEALNNHEMTQKDLAEQLSTTQQTVSRWIKGINEPDLATLLEICYFLDETPNSILGYDDLTENDFLSYFQDPEVIEESGNKLTLALFEEAYENNKK